MTSGRHLLPSTYRRADKDPIDEKLCKADEVQSSIGLDLWVVYVARHRRRSRRRDALRRACRSGPQSCR